jgi:hypothetical protein
METRNLRQSMLWGLGMIRIESTPLDHSLSESPRVTQQRRLNGELKAEEHEGLP